MSGGNGGPYRVVQWATGNIGTRSLRAVIEHPALELVGLFVYSEAKAGKDAGELCGLGATGVMAAPLARRRAAGQRARAGPGRLTGSGRCTAALDARDTWRATRSGPGRRRRPDTNRAAS